MSHSLWDVVKVPFPYTNRNVAQRRPALVIARHQGRDMPALLWVVMITSATHRRWPGDVVISDLNGAGLPAASVVRPVKVATIEASSAETIGHLGASERAIVATFLSASFELEMGREGR